MAIAYDAFSSSSEGTGELGWVHSPSGTPNGVLVFITQYNSGADQVSGVTYGGVAMSEVALSPLLKTTGEACAVYAYFLGSGIPTGNQAVTVTVSGSAAKRAACITMTSASGTAVQDTTTISSDSLLNPSGTLSLGGVSCFCAQAFTSGAQTVGSVTPLTNWTERLEHDFGAEVAGWYTYNTIGTADVTFGYTASADDVVCIGVAVKEITLATGRVSAADVDLTSTTVVARASAADLDLTSTNITGRASAADLDLTSTEVAGRASAADLDLTTSEIVARLSAGDLDVDWDERGVRMSAADLDLTTSEIIGRLSAGDLDITSTEVVGRASAADLDLDYTEEVGPPPAEGLVSAADLDLTAGEITGRVSAGDLDLTTTEIVGRMSAADLDLTAGEIVARVSAADLDIDHTELAAALVSAADLDLNYTEERHLPGKVWFPWRASRGGSGVRRAGTGVGGRRPGVGGGGD